MSHNHGILVRLLIITLFAEGFIYKSFAQAFIGSSLVHYLLSGILCSITIIVYLFTDKTRRALYCSSEALSIYGLLIWSFAISLFKAPLYENVGGAILFGLLVLTFFWAVPRLAEHS